jgi:hypothetical protein
VELLKIGVKELKSVKILMLLELVRTLGLVVVAVLLYNLAPQALLLLDQESEILLILSENKRTDNERIMVVS